MLKITAAGLLLASAYYYLQSQSGQGGEGDSSAAGDLMDTLTQGIDQVTNLLTPWRAPALYADAIAAAETANGIPAHLLERQLYQESHWRPEIINGTLKSPSGAIGVAQFMPGTARDFGIDPTDPDQSIAAAGRYMAQLYTRFGTWEQALAAYNWGMGNVSRKGLGAAPAETRNYFTQILSDLGMPV